MKSLFRTGSLFGKLQMLAYFCVGQLLCLPMCEGTVVYVPQIPPIDHFWLSSLGNPEPIDLDGDGAADLSIREGFGFGADVHGGTAVLGRQRFVDPIEPFGREVFVHASVAGEVIGPVSGTPTDQGVFWRADPQYVGPTNYFMATGVPSNILSFGGEFFSTRKFLGVRLEPEPGVFHYGWVDIENNMAKPWNYRIHGWAYETEPNKAIIAGAVPEPGGGALLLVAGMVVAFRRNRRWDLAR
jgi:hypothetical protein